MEQKTIHSKPPTSTTKVSFPHFFPANSIKHGGSFHRFFQSPRHGMLAWERRHAGLQAEDSWPRPGQPGWSTDVRCGRGEGPQILLGMLCILADFAVGC